MDDFLAMPAPAPDWRAQARARNDGLPIAKRDWFDGQPPDDAPAHVLLEYWAVFTWYDDDELPPLTDNLRRKLLQGCEQYPDLLPDVLRFLPDTPAAHKRVASLLANAEPGYYSEDWYAPIRKWLTLHSDRFRPQLIARAQAATDEEGWVEGEDALRALAEADRAVAQPILRKHLAGDQPKVAALSLALLYANAVRSEEGGASGQLREQLKRLASNRSAGGYSRDVACQALMATEWPGRDSWFLALFSDPTINIIEDGFLVTPLVYPVLDDPDYWIPRVTPLVGREDRAAHNAAVRCLEQFNLEDARADAMRPLLPWLSDPAWAELHCSTGRLRLIQSLDRVDLPECVDGLIWVAAHDVGDGLSAAAQALAHYRVKTAAPVLKAALAREPQECQRRLVIQSVLALGGSPVDEMAAAVEAYAREIATEEGSRRVTDAMHSVDGALPLDPQVSIGRCLGYQWDKPDEELARRLVARVWELRASEFLVSQSMWLIIRTWPTRAVDQEIVRRVAAGEVDKLSVHSALKRRMSLRANTREDLERLCERGGAQLGMAACLIGAGDRYVEILEGSDSTAQRALLACARLVREPLPLHSVGALLQSRDEGVADAAQRFLEGEDSAAARRLVLARHPGEAWILGARQQSDPGHTSYGQLDKWEERLREVVRADGGPDEVLAVLSAGYWGDAGQRVIYVRGEAAELRFYQDETQCQSRKLADEEWRDLRGFLSDNSVENLAPLNTSVHDGMQYEYVRLARHGGRRVFMNNPSAIGGSLYDQLVCRFTRLSEPLKQVLSSEWEAPQE